MNFIVDLPRAQKDFDRIFMVVDRHTKVTRFINTRTIVRDSGVTKLFV